MTDQKLELLVIILLWVLSVLIAYILGFYLHNVKTKINSLQKSISKIYTEKFTNKPTEEDDAPSVIIDPDDVAQMAKFEHDELMRKLNPDK